MTHRAFPNHDGRDFPRDLLRDFPLAGSEGGGAPGINIAVTSVLVPGSTGNVDITTLDMNGVTPKAVYFMATNHLSANDASESLQFNIATGAADGTNQWWTNTYSEDGVADTDNSRINHDNGCFRVHDPASASSGDILAAATFVSFINNGVRINFTNVDRPDIRIIVVFFGGDDVSAHVNKVALGTGTSAIDITDPGFEPDLVYINSCSDAENTVSNAMQHSSGFLINDGAAKQMSIGMTEFFNQAAGDLNNIIHSTRCFVTNTYNLLGGTFDANGFSLTPSASAASDFCYYLALKFTGKSVALVEFDTPTSTGAQTYNPGFTPEFYWGMVSNLTARDAIQDNDGVGLCVGTDDNQGVISTYAEFDAATTNCGCDTRDGVALQGIDVSDADAIEASLTSFGAGGAEFNYSAVLGVAHKGYMFMLGE